MAAEVSLLAAGLPGSVVVSVFSTALGANTGFVIPRTIPATALLFSEPDITLPGTSISRRSSSDASKTSCSRPNSARKGSKHNHIDSTNSPIVAHKVFSPSVIAA